MSCGHNDAEIVMQQYLELCLHCLESRIEPIEPGSKFTIVLAIQSCGYDEGQDDG